MQLPDKTFPQTSADDKRSLGHGVFCKCDGCGAVLTSEQLRDNWQVCPRCGHHHALAASGWRSLLLDEGELQPWDEEVLPGDPLKFDDGTPYAVRLAKSKTKTGHADALDTGLGKIQSTAVAYGCFVFPFMGGSMGSVVGERMARLFERATDLRLPVVLLHASGGARMQEGILSLMQMAKTVAALERFRAVRRPYLSVLLHPTTGGVAASTALLGDVNVAEQGALIGFAGPRVIENTLRTRLPPGFQRSEFLREHGMVDVVVPRTEMRDALGCLLRHLGSTQP